MKGLSRYLVLWGGQSISRLGSAMTAFALTAWSFSQTETVLSVSLLQVCIFLSSVLVSFFAGPVIDRSHKKAVMLISDSVAALVTLGVMLLKINGVLRLEMLYAANILFGLTGAFQGPASEVAVTRLVPKAAYMRVSGLQSLSGAIQGILSPVLAMALYAFGDLDLVITVDLCSFVFAFVTLCLTPLPEPPRANEVAAKRSGLISTWREGAVFLKARKGILCLIAYLMVINLISGISYFSVLTPMILARTGYDQLQAGYVNSCIGVGMLIGAAIVSARKPTKNLVRVMCVSYMLSFLLCDFLLGVGRTLWVWCLAALLGNLTIPMGDAALSVLLRTNTPEAMQGRVYALRSASVHACTLTGYLLGAALADQAAPALAASQTFVGDALRFLLGEGPGRAMGFVFVITCLIGVFASLSLLKSRSVRALREAAEK